MTEFTVCKIDGFGANIRILVAKTQNWEENKECAVYIQEDEDHGDCVLLGRFPSDQAFDFSETIATGFGIFQYNMTVDNTKYEDNG